MAAQVVREERERVERRYARLTRLVAFELAQQLGGSGPNGGVLVEEGARHRGEAPQG